MNKKSYSSISTNSTKSNDTKPNSIVISKLRRLKIEENLFLQNLQKLDRKNNYEVSESDVDCKNVLKNLKNSYLNIKNLFDDVKTVTCSQELLAELEIDDIKNKVLELEKTMKSFKLHLNTELSLLKTAEQDLTKQMEEINCRKTSVSSKRGKVLSANYNQVVPSPVRLIMTSRLKCPEVQEFQDFMKSCSNRYGGWNEYHHNVFVKYWQKHFGSQNQEHNSSLVENLAFENFVEEALFSLQGINKECLLSHVEWYKKYLLLKEKQQKAIDKWKSNKRSMRKFPPEKVMKGNFGGRVRGAQDRDVNDRTGSTEDKLNNMVELSRQQSQHLEIKKTFNKQAKPTPTILVHDVTERLMKPTKQWLNRNNEEEQIKQRTLFIENLEKLRIPTWRKYLT